MVLTVRYSTKAAALAVEPQLDGQNNGALTTGQDISQLQTLTSSPLSKYYSHGCPRNQDNKCMQALLAAMS
jgi:hypothetical protein